MSYSLGDILGKRGYIRGPFGSSLRRGEMLDQGIPVYEQLNAIHNNREFRYFIDENKFQELERFKVEEGDVLISCSGTVGKTTIIKTNDPLGIISQALLILRPNRELMIPEFLKYFLDSKVGQERLISRSHGSVQTNIAKRSDVETLQLPNLSLEVQKKVVSILSSLDDKIELNIKINKTLEEFAQTLYKHWFVDFEFPNEEGKPYKSYGGEMVESEIGMIPSEWTVVELNKLVYQNRIKSDPVGSEVLIDMANMPSYSISLGSYDSGDKLKTNLFKMKKYDLLYGSIRPYLGKFGIAPRDGLTTGTVHCLNVNKNSDYSFVASMIFSTEFNNYCVQISDGTKMPIVKWRDFASYKTAYSEYISEKFDLHLKSSFRMIVQNVNQNDNLIKLRDLLLPKLLSGEIEV
jgi:type I restriction enzyme, S subunit